MGESDVQYLISVTGAKVQSGFVCPPPFVSSFFSGDGQVGEQMPAGMGRCRQLSIQFSRLLLAGWARPEF
jgi:hypothetical protein